MCIRDSPDHVLVQDPGRRDPFFPASLHRPCRRVNEAQLVQPLHHRPQAAGIVQIHQAVLSRRVELDQVGDPVADVIHTLEIKFQAGLVGDRRQVQHGIGGAAQGHICDEAIMDGPLRHDLSGGEMCIRDSP